MNPSQSLSLTQQGLDELKTRVYKLNMRKRSVLLLLERPQTIQYIMEKTVFSPKELLEEVSALVKDGFLSLGDAAGLNKDIAHAASSAAAHKSSRPEPAPSLGDFSIKEDIVLSEARFLMVDFCVDVFGTNSQAQVESLRQCKDVGQFANCVKQIHDMTKSTRPDQLSKLQAIVKEINQTAL